VTTLQNEVGNLSSQRGKLMHHCRYWKEEHNEYVKQTKVKLSRLGNQAKAESRRPPEDLSNDFVDLGKIVSRKSPVLTEVLTSRNVSPRHNTRKATLFGPLLSHGSVAFLSIAFLISPHERPNPFAEHRYHLLPFWRRATLLPH
jgi:hypothetical protein